LIRKGIEMGLPGYHADRQAPRPSTARAGNARRADVHEFSLIPPVNESQVSAPAAGVETSHAAAPCFVARRFEYARSVTRGAISLARLQASVSQVFASALAR
jgi:hypothetical protein